MGRRDAWVTWVTWVRGTGAGATVSPEAVGAAPDSGQISTSACVQTHQTHGTHAAAPSPGVLELTVCSAPVQGTHITHVTHGAVAPPPSCSEAASETHETHSFQSHRFEPAEGDEADGAADTFVEAVLDAFPGSELVPDTEPAWVSEGLHGRSRCWNCGNEHVWRLRGGVESFCGTCHPPGVPPEDSEWQRGRGWEESRG